MLAADPADIGHVPAISADGQAAFSGDLPLLFRAHRSETAAALLPAFGFGSGSPAGGCWSTGGAPSLGSAAGASALAAAPVLAFAFFHAAAPAGPSPAGGCLAIGFFGLDAHGAGLVFVPVGFRVAVLVGFAARFTDREGALSTVA
jgi:hypothetical protein